MPEMMLHLLALANRASLDFCNWTCFYCHFNYISGQYLQYINLSLSVYRVEVMEQLIQSSDLFVMQVEMDVYTALKKVEKAQS